jgi:Ser/Thr protein kinase RdoA (MazF antagonist)
VPGCCPKIIAEDRTAGLFVMEYLSPEENQVWKSCLGAGRADAGFAAQVGATLARIHAATAGDAALARRFGDTEMFHALRLEPYLVTTARLHPRVASHFESLVERTRMMKKALIHGDVSPKNILVGPSGPMMLDAECAWYGDPAFDLAFPLSHLMLKGIWVPKACDGLLASYVALVEAYLEGVDWERGDDLAKRAAGLLPALLLARVDGKSPVEYLTEEADRNHVRTTAEDLMALPSTGLNDIAGKWFGELAATHH